MSEKIWIFTHFNRFRSFVFIALICLLLLTGCASVKSAGAPAAGEAKA